MGNDSSCEESLAELTQPRGCEVPKLHNNNSNDRSPPSIYPNLFDSDTSCRELMPDATWKKLRRATVRYVGLLRICPPGSTHLRTPNLRAARHASSRKVAWLAALKVPSAVKPSRYQSTKSRSHLSRPYGRSARPHPFDQRRGQQPDAFGTTEKKTLTESTPRWLSQFGLEKRSALQAPFDCSVLDGFYVLEESRS